MSYSANLVKAALDVAVGTPIYNVTGLLTAEETNSLTSRRERVKRDLLEQFEIALLTNLTHQLRYDRHNDSVIYFRSTPGQEGDCSAERAEYWYRAMKKSEFQLHKKSDEFAELPDFAGVAPSRKYSKGYLTNDSAESILLEWHIPAAGKLHQLMTANGIQVKAEGGGTYGLGTEGTNVKPGGDREVIWSRVIFNSICGRFKIVDFRVPNRLNACL